MNTHFEEELKSLKEQLVRMAGLVEQMIADTIVSLKDRNESPIENVFAAEKLVNQLQLDIDDKAVKMIALHQPTASDLRFLITAIKINSELERIGDQSINIVETTRELLKQPQLKPLIDIPRMAEISSGMLKDSIDAFIKQDTDLAKNVCERDDQVDTLKDQILRELLTYMISDPTTISRALSLILIARNLERIGDHATNIGEEVIFMVQGKDIRHHANQ
jgi:phosphate transport system protein